MVATWIESAAKGRNAGPIRAGMWSAAVVGTHPIEADQRVWLELYADDLALGRIPTFWIENKAGNSYWHAPIPPQAVGVRLHYRSVAEHRDSETAYSAYQDSIVRPNLPDRTEAPDLLSPALEGLVGNRHMTVRVDGRGSTYDVYFPTVGLHSNVRPKEGDLPQSRSHFRAIVGGLAVGRRLDWFTERSAWDAFQNYSGATNLLTTDLAWRQGPVRVHITDFVAMGDTLPSNAGMEKSPGQYIKRFRIKNEGPETRQAIFGVYVQAEVNGGVGDTGLSWHDQDRALLAINRGHGHSNRKLARDATVEFALALDPRGDVACEPTGPNEAILYRWIELPPGESVTVDLLVSGAFTGWRGDQGTFVHWLRPALNWFRSTDLDAVEQSTAREWDDFVEPIPTLHLPRAAYAVSLRRSALAAALHADIDAGSVAAGLDRGLSAYCWPRDAIWVGGALARLGHPEILRGVFGWLNRVRARNSPFLYWFQKYSIDGMPEWETPAVDQTALIPWGLERYYRATGDLAFVAGVWPMVEQAALVCGGDSGGHPGLFFDETLNLVSSAGMGDQLYGRFLYSNAAVVAGLRAAARMAASLNRTESADRWNALADRIWNDGVMKAVATEREGLPGLIDPETGRFLSGRGISMLRGLWTQNPTFVADRAGTVDVNTLALASPFHLLPATDPHLLKTAETILRANTPLSGDPNVLARMSYPPVVRARTGHVGEHPEISSLATFWMIRYLIELGRESGQGRHWTRAITMIDALLTRLGPLGLLFRSGGRLHESARIATTPGGTAWGLHAMMIETMLDLAGLEYDAVARRLEIRPVLAGSWPQTGVSRKFPCGDVTYRLERPLGGAVHRLTFDAVLTAPITLDVAVTCPGLTELGPWQSTPDSPAPEFDPKAGRLSWTLPMGAGDHRCSWTWG
ncbi:glycosyl hydrolase [Paludisphaera mucosa]|uniref:Glycosyl hydrolase n=1 Tax=Paludisphaera mucosa TaxID=3030827 RepID=A0ABT6FFX0_9BACT|nr:glycosyl hydrolase [Paludisphaera mucosa]MDG3006481.1 glycosyl hydrolase [Paludisphaera mucosa]